jgi:hypothetical protein
MKIKSIVSQGVMSGGACAALFLAGCATSPDYQTAGDPYAAAIYTGAPQPDAADLYAQLYAPEQRSANGTPFELVSYAGIEGARRAHQLYTESEAEALDGRCESAVAPTTTESMIDIANLCDVPLDMLVEYNPGIADISYSTDGAMVKIPGGIVEPKGAFAMTDMLVQLDAVQPGDTLETIAYRLNVSETAIANLNPGIDWKNPIAGQAFVTPVTAPQVAANAPTASYAAPAAAPVWEGYGGAQGISGSRAGRDIGVALAPYDLDPIRSYGRAKGVYPDADLSVDRQFVKAGGAVEVTAKAEPGSAVDFYMGEAPGDGMSKKTTAVAGPDGKATARVRVGKKSNMGGVIFGARQAGTNDTKYSDRVGVIRLEDELRDDGDHRRHRSGDDGDADIDQGDDADQ